MSDLSAFMQFIQAHPEVKEMTLADGPYDRLLDEVRPMLRGEASMGLEKDRWPMLLRICETTIRRES